MVNFNVVVGEFQYFPSDLSTNLLGVPPVPEVVMIRAYNDFVGGAY